MLILPLEKTIDWRKPPIITFLLIIINTIVLIFTQSQDESVFKSSIDYYLSSDLAVIELPRYLETKPFANDDSSNEKLIAAIEKKEADKKTIVGILMAMENNQAFMKKLHNDEIINKQNKDYKPWKTARTQFDDLMHSSISSRYSFTPSKHDPVTFLTHLFLHADYGHLIGNMVFLFLIGFTLETALGSLLYLVCYLISGLGAVTLFWLVYFNSDIGLVGASGAIAGLMGMYAGVFGFRKIRFFYSLLFYFDFIKAPALIMLPLWIANEIYQLVFTEGSNVAYMAHVGGLLTGGIISFTIKKYFNTKIDMQYLDKAVQQDEKLLHYEQGMKLFRELKIAQAQHVFSNLYAQYPNDTDILIQYYKTLKYTPENNNYDAIVAKIFEITDSYNVKQTHSVFKDYIKSRKNIKISSKTLIKLALLFTKNNYPVEAELIIQSLLRKSADIEGLEQALFALAIAWKNSDNSEKYITSLELLVKYYPNETIGINANKLLEKLQSKN
jgi:membrane associated rhomboid family serine protease